MRAVQLRWLDLHGRRLWKAAPLWVGRGVRCSQSSCTSRQSTATVPVQYPINMDGGLDTLTTMTATLVIGSSRITVHLTRQ